MKKNLMSVAFHPAMLALLLPLTGGCALHAQGAIRAPHVSFSASLPLPPPPPIPVVTVRASVPAPSSTVVVRPPRVVANTSTASSATVEASAPAPSTVTPATPPPPSSVTTSNSAGAVFVGGMSVYTVSVNAAPPPIPTHVTIAPPIVRPGFVWVRPHYSWNGSRWIWTGGRWLTARANRDWIQAHYDAERRIFIQGHWESREHVESDIGLPSPIIVNPDEAIAPSTSASASASSSASFNVGFNAEANFSAGTH